MNVRNILDSRLHKIRDSCEPTNKRHTPNTKSPQTSKHNQSGMQNAYRFSTNATINSVPSMPQTHAYYRMPQFLGPNMFPPTNYRNMPFVSFNTPPPLHPPNMQPFQSNMPLPPPTVFLNPPPPGVDMGNHEPPLVMRSSQMNLTTPAFPISTISTTTTPNLRFYNPPPPPPPHMNWYNLPPSSSGAFGGLPYYQKP